MVTVERHPVRGHYVVSALVDDGAGEWLMTRTYDGYTKRAAVAMFREYCDGSGVRIVGGR